MLQRLFRSRPAAEAGRRLYASAAARSRAPALYARMGAPDTFEGRFEIYSLHVILLLHRLKGQGDAAHETAQRLFDAYIKGLDDGLREMGVGDVVVGKKMRKLGEAAYGRMQNYETALASADPEPLAALLRRTVFSASPQADPQPLAAYVRQVRDALAAAPLETLLSGEAPWPPIES